MSLMIVLYTYSPSADHPRHEYTLRTLSAVLSLVKTSQEISLHVADDGSGADHIDGIFALAKEFGYEPSMTNAERGGYGKSYNLASQVSHSFDYILHVEDDWELQRELDLDPLICALRDSQYGCIRLGYLGWYNHLVGEMVREADQNFIHFLNQYSDDPHIWTGHPRLEKAEWSQQLGEWPEGFEPGTTEIKVSNKPQARWGVLWPLDLVKTDGDLFGHIGEERAR